MVLVMPKMKLFSLRTIGEIVFLPLKCFDSLQIDF